MFAEPYSLKAMPKPTRDGLIAVAFFATISVVSTTILIGLIVRRLFTWSHCYKQYVQANQYVLFILNLLIADLFQSLAFMISWHWIGLRSIDAPTSACFTQAWFLHIGDVASGAFVNAIAAHTLLLIRFDYKLSFRGLVFTIVSIWGFAALMTNLGPFLHQLHFFTRAGAWCWVSPQYEAERLWLHYLWIFINQASTLGIYLYLFWRMRQHIQNPILGRSYDAGTTKRLWRATWYMFLYAGAYLVLTSPLAIGRMVAMGGHNLSDVYLIVAGCIMTSCGWVDVIMYTYTHKTLLSGAPDVAEQQGLPPRRSKNSVMMYDFGPQTTIAGGPAVVTTKYTRAVQNPSEDLSVPPTAARHVLGSRRSDPDNTRHIISDFTFEMTNERRGEA